MQHYSKYLVNNGDEFRSSNYPQLLKDLRQIQDETVRIPNTLKAEILLSFTKNHSLKNEWIAANPDFARLVTTGGLPIKEIEALFEACAKNALFQQQLEHFLKSFFDAPSNKADLHQPPAQHLKQAIIL